MQQDSEMLLSMSIIGFCRSSWQISQNKSSLRGFKGCFDLFLQLKSTDMHQHDKPKEAKPFVH